MSVSWSMRVFRELWMPRLSKVFGFYPARFLITLYCTKAILRSKPLPSWGVLLRLCATDHHSWACWLFMPMMDAPLSTQLLPNTCGVRFCRKCTWPGEAAWVWVCGSVGLCSFQKALSLLGEDFPGWSLKVSTSFPRLSKEAQEIHS